MRRTTLKGATLLAMLPAHQTPCVIFACFLPDESKRYVLEEIVQEVQHHLGDVAVYCGIQHGSDPRTEAWLEEMGADLTWHFKRVPKELAIDSDAATFVTALELLRAIDTPHSLCYFIHTKAITSGEDGLRRELLLELFDLTAISRAFASKRIGSYGPRLTITHSAEDRQAMTRWLSLFTRASQLPTLPYFYAHTMWVARGPCVAMFVNAIDDRWFSTPVSNYSDRYFAERDLPHFVDALCGLQPTFKSLVGNHSTSYQRTRQREFYAELLKWRLRAALSRWSS